MNLQLSTFIFNGYKILFSYIQFSSHQYFLKGVAYACFMLKSFISSTYFNIINK